MLAILLSAHIIYAQTENTVVKGKKLPQPTVQATYNCPMHPEVVSNVSGKCPKCNSPLTQSKKEDMKMSQMKLYTCPMHPEVKSNKPGTCAKCGMALAKQKVVTNQKKGNDHIHPKKGS